MVQNYGPVVVRDARAEEFEHAARLIAVAFQQYAAHIPAEHWERYQADSVNVWSRQEDAELVVALLDGQVVGTVTYYPDGSRYGRRGWPEGWAAVRLLAVLPEARGKGVGRALTEECIRRSRERGLTALALHTTELMATAQSLYERMGFVRAPEFDFVPPSGVTALAYRFAL